MFNFEKGYLHLQKAFIQLKFYTKKQFWLIKP